VTALDGDRFKASTIQVTPKSETQEISSRLRQLAGAYFSREDGLHL